MFIVACVVSSNASTDSKALKFAGFWTVLLMIALVGGGTLIMRRYQTPLALGFFLGAVVVMANQCLILTAIFGEESEKNNDKVSEERGRELRATCDAQNGLTIGYDRRDDTIDPHRPILSHFNIPPVPSPNPNLSPSTTATF